MEVRNGQGEKQPARVVPVVLGLDHFSAGRRYELADVDLQALAHGRQVFQISFLEVLIEVCLGSGPGQVSVALTVFIAWPKPKAM